MATTLRGYLDGFRGLLGNAVGSKWRTIDVIKGRPSKSNKPKTPAQLEQQMRFGLATGFVTDLINHIKIGYQSYSDTPTTAGNAAVQHILKDAIVGVYPALTIDYSKIRISKGRLIGLNQLEAKMVDDEITVTWENTKNVIGGAADTDLAIGIFYDPIIQQYLLIPNVPRSALKFTAPLLYYMRGHKVYAWVFVTSADGKTVSNSTFLGQFDMPAAIA